MGGAQHPPEENNYLNTKGDLEKTTQLNQVPKCPAGPTSEPVDNFSSANFCAGVTMSRVVEHLAQLPDLARRTAPRPKDRDVDLGGGDPARYTKPEYGPRLPPGLDMAAIDSERDRQHSIDQLAKLSQCVRVVLEERDDAWHHLPDPGACPTWRSEVAWLLTTHPWWSTNAWCVEWITTEVSEIRATLIERVERRNGWTRCALCGGEITTYATEVLDVAECKRCERVISMREREALTVPEVARRLGISEEAAQKRVERGHLRKVGRRGKQTLVAPPDGLDWAREKLGLPTGGVA